MSRAYLKRNAAIVLCSVMLSAPTFAADRQTDTDYECEMLAEENLGVRCHVWRQPYPQKPLLLVWLDEDRSLDEASKKRTNYQVRQIMQAFVDRGATLIEVRQFRDDKHQVQNCNRVYRRSNVTCHPWQIADSPPGPEWDPLLSEE